MGKLCELEGCTRLEPVGTARRMAAANGAKRRAAPSQLETTRGTVWRMAEAGGASTRAAPRQLLQATRSTAARMAEVNGASKRAAPSQLLQATRSTAAPARMEGQTVPARGLPQASRESSRQCVLHAMSAGHTAAARRCGGARTPSTRADTQLARARGDPAAGGGLRVNQFTAEARPGLLIADIGVVPFAFQRVFQRESSLIFSVLFLSLAAEEARAL
jgi:hypothetical protein